MFKQVLKEQLTQIKSVKSNIVQSYLKRLLIFILKKRFISWE